LSVLEGKYHFNLTTKELYFYERENLALPVGDILGFKVIKTQEDVDNTIIARIYELGEMPNISRIILSSGDKDYAKAMKDVKSRGKDAYVAWFGHLTSPKLREAVGEDHFIGVSRRKLIKNPIKQGF